MHLYGHSLPTTSALLIGAELLLALSFIFANGFHDTANAIAALVYTNSMPPQFAAVWSGIWNFIGALAASGAVAYGILALLPAELILAAGKSAGLAMVFSLLLSALLWNLGTWYFGLPISSSHTLVGSILGIGLSNAWISKGSFAEGLNWAQAKDTALALIVSPVLGFVFAGILILLSRLLIRNPKLHSTPDHPGQPPPFFLRGLLLLTSTGVSFTHGSNDGQKGMGLVMLVLIGTLPGAFAIDMRLQEEATSELIRDTQITSAVLRRHVSLNNAPLSGGYADQELNDFLGSKAHQATEDTYSALVAKNGELVNTLQRAGKMSRLESDKRTGTRMNILLVSQTINRLLDQGQVTDPAERSTLRAYRRRIDRLTKYVPGTVRLAAALAIGLGTMVAWRRVATTIGAKIGKGPLTYAQGLCAELTAMTIIAAADRAGLPVSTTYLVSSGIAGGMVADRVGLRAGTVRNVLLAWAFTVPVSLVLSGALFALGRQMIKLAGVA